MKNCLEGLQIIDKLNGRKYKFQILTRDAQSWVYNNFGSFLDATEATCFSNVLILASRHIRSLCSFMSWSRRLSSESDVTEDVLEFWLELLRLGMVPPGMELPGLEPPGLEPPGLEPPGLEPPGLEPPGLEPPGLEPPGLDDFEIIFFLFSLGLVVSLDDPFCLPEFSDDGEFKRSWNSLYNLSS